METVRSIVEAAARILESSGHSGYNTNAVALLAGVSPGSLYQYFPNKEALTKALIVRETSALMDSIREASRTPGGRDALEAIIAAVVRHQMKRPALARLLDFEEPMIFTDPDAEYVSRQAREILIEILTRPDIPRQCELTTVADDLVAITKGIVSAASVRRERDGKSLQSRVSRAVLGYLGLSSSSQPS